MKKQLLTTLSILAVTISAFAQSAGGGACSELFISEYVEGTGNNRAIELFNPTPNPVNLSNYSVGRYANGITTGMFSNLAGTIAPYDTYVIALDKRDPNGVELEIPISAALEAAADTFLNPVYVASNSPMYFNGNDAVALRKFGTVIDILGTIGENPAIGWFDFATGNWSTENQTLVRKPNVQEGDWNGFDTYYPDFEWDNYAVNTFSNLGSHTNSCFTPPCSTPSAVGFSGLNTSYNTSDAPTTLTGSPAGGVFFGDGLDGNDFNPAFAGVGTHSIVYTYVDGNGCIGSYGLCTTVDFNV
ncbi:MAG: lamin tail domain-containing protein, partial [Flavobacteriales bacterium]